jgi:hypothetical protein
MAAADMEEMRQGRPTVAEYEAHELELKAWSDITFITMAKANAGALSGMNKVVHAHVSILVVSPSCRPEDSR